MHLDSANPPSLIINEADVSNDYCINDESSLIWSKDNDDQTLKSGISNIVFFSFEHSDSMKHSSSPPTLCVCV